MPPSWTRSREAGAGRSPKPEGPLPAWAPRLESSDLRRSASRRGQQSGHGQRVKERARRLRRAGEGTRGEESLGQPAAGTRLAGPGERRDRTHPMREPRDERSGTRGRTGPSARQPARGLGHGDGDGRGARAPPAATSTGAAATGGRAPAPGRGSRGPSPAAATGTTEAAHRLGPRRGEGEPQGAWAPATSFTGRRRAGRAAARNEPSSGGARDTGSSSRPSPSEETSSSSGSGSSARRATGKQREAPQGETEASGSARRRRDAEGTAKASSPSQNNLYRVHRDGSQQRILGGLYPKEASCAACSASNSAERCDISSSLRRNLPTPPPPPRDPDRDPRLPLPGSPGDIRRREAARSSISDVDREATLPAELVARPPPVSRPRDEPAPRAPPARAPAHMPSASTWRRDRQDHRRDEWRGAPHSRRGDEDRRSDWRSSRAEGADWRRDVGPSRRVSPEAPPAAPMPVLAPAKKKKSKKKKVVAAIPGARRLELTAPPLEKVWVLVYGLPRGGCAAPRGGKLAHILKAISEPVGKLITADLASFEDDGPARIEILCPAPAEIDGLSLVFYFGTKGRRLTFELESPAPVDPLGLAEVVPEPGDGGLDDEGGSSEEDSSSEGDGDDGGAPPAPSDGRRNHDSLPAGPPGLAGDPPVVALVPVTAVVTRSSPPGATVPGIVAAEEVSVGMEVCLPSTPPGGLHRLRVPSFPNPRVPGHRPSSGRRPRLDV
ncbi:hypothetical protein ZWY2020_003475 [Hordeum vulgare]|nr:hypothetical protein ZWY2020_003475 [Hordeum vulgare]